MTVAYRRASLVASASAFLALAACSGKSKPMDDGLKQDLAATSSNGLELAPSSANTQVIVSAIEGGPESAPAPAARKIVPKPTPKPAPRVASISKAPVDAPMPGPQITAPAPAPSRPSPQAEPAPAANREPPPLPPAANQAQGRQKGVYKTEGQIFQQMPWIKP